MALVGGGEGVLVDADRVEVVGVLGAVGRGRGVEARDLSDELVELTRVGAPALGVLGQTRELLGADRALDISHAVVEADGGVLVLRGLAVGAEGADLVEQVLVVGGDHAALARGHVLGGVEGVGDGVAEGSDAACLVGREVGLGSVVDDGEALVDRELLDAVDVDGVAVDVGGGDGDGLVGDLPTRVLDVDTVGDGVGVDPDDLGTLRLEHGGGGDVGPRGAEDLVAPLDETAVGELERTRAVGAGRGVLSARGRSEGVLEGHHLLTLGEHARAHHLEGGVDVRVVEADGDDLNLLIDDGCAAVEGESLDLGALGEGGGHIAAFRGSCLRGNA